jgi:hypothetical protein
MTRAAGTNRAVRLPGAVMVRSSHVNRECETVLGALDMELYIKTDPDLPAQGDDVRRVPDDLERGAARPDVREPAVARRRGG